MLRLLILLAACSTGTARAAALEPVEEIVVEGNTRTSRDEIIRVLGVRPGDRLEEDALPELRQRLLNLRIFREVEVESRPSGDNVILAVSVKERWTLLPIPMIGASEGAFRAGLAFFESNLLGRRKQLALIAGTSSRGQSAIALYRDPALLGTRAVLAAELAAENVARERADGFDVIYAWRDRRFDASVRPGLQLTRRVAVRAGPFVLLRESRTEGGYAAPPPAGRDLGIAADLEVAGQDYRDWFEAGPALRGRVRQALPALGSERRFTQATVHGAWSVQAFRDHAASAALSGFASDGDPILDGFALGGRPGSRGLKEGGLWVERAAIATVDYQVPLWRPGWGTVTGLGFLDGGVTTWRGERVRYVAPGAGFRVYVRNVALPAMGLDLAWSTAGRSFAPSFFLGFGS
jgi:outer membrane protein assembly factor BamA